MITRSSKKSWTYDECLEKKECDDLKDLFERTFDLCKTNREELYWLICILRGLMNIPNKRKEQTLTNQRINFWQYYLYPYIESYKHRWHHSNRKGQNTL